ncbi:MAG: primosomal protein N' [Agrococcus casei]
MTASVAQVILDTRLPQLDKVLDYAIAEDQRETIALGCRVRVPVRGSRLTVGYVVGLADSSEFDGRLQEIERVVSPAPVLQPEVLELARAVARRAAGNLSDVLRLAIPPRQARQETGRDWLPWPEPQPAGEGDRQVADLSGGVVALPSGDTVGAWAAQLAARAAACVAAGKQAIIVVPDFRDQRQLAAALAAVLEPDQIAELDARQPAKERYRSFLRTLSAQPMAVIGPRSTVYAPASDLGLLVVFDDGDPLHAEPLAPHVSTRDAALIRHSLSGADLLFAGHSRSVAVQRLVEIGYCRVEPLPVVEGSAPRPKVSVADFGDSGPQRIPSAAFRAVQQGLEQGPVLVQVAKPGEHTRLVCQQCRALARCVQCQGPLDAGSRTLSCKWCGRTQPPFECPTCEGRVIAKAGSGSQKTAAELGRAFPGHSVTVADGSHELLEIDDRPRLVVATTGAAPVAAGGYRAVVLLDGESHLSGERLGVAEDYVRQSRNTMALAASDARCVITGASGAVATAVQTATAAGFAASELEGRQETSFPPAVRVASVSGDPAIVRRAVESLADVPKTDTLGTVDIVGPDGTSEVRTIVRFAYGSGTAVADELRAQVLRAAAKSRKNTGRLRVRMDDLTPFEGGA